MNAARAYSCVNDYPICRLLRDANFYEVGAATWISPLTLYQHLGIEEGSEWQLRLKDGELRAAREERGC